MKKENSKSVKKLQPPKEGYRCLGKAPISGIDFVNDGQKIKEVWSSVMVEQQNQNSSIKIPKLKDIFIDKPVKKGKIKGR